MDERLKKAISKGEEERQSEYKKELKKQQEEEKKKQEYIASFAKAADEWVDKHLFEKIAEAQKQGRNQMSVPCAPNIPDEAIRNAIQKIKGLAVYSEWIRYDDDSARIEEWFVSWAKTQDQNLINLQLLYNYRGQ